MFCLGVIKLNDNREVKISASSMEMLIAKINPVVKAYGDKVIDVFLSNKKEEI